MSDHIRHLLNDMDQLFNGFFHWLAEQYDWDTGGFYYARSSKRNSQFTPDIESTAQGLNIILRNNLLDKMPNEMREKLIQFFQQKQQPQTGYFYDEHPAMRKDDVMVHRAIGYCSRSLERLGSAPLYPLPYASDAAPDYVKSPEAYLEKWKTIDLRNSWRGCDQLATSCFYMAEMSEEERIPYLRQATEYLESIQDPKTGLWGGGSLYLRISGTFKLQTFYSIFDIPMPNEDLIYKSILQCLRTEEASDMCYIRNPINLIDYLKPNMTENELIEIIQITTDNLRKLKRDDGGFSREIDRSPPAPNVAQIKKGEYYPDMPEPVNIGLGLYEGDMNASTQASLIRMQCYDMAGILKPPELIGVNDFYDIIKHTKEL